VASRDRRRKRAAYAETAWYALLVLASAGVLFSGVVATAAVSPAFCALCHASAADALEASAHAGTQCDACHAGQGAFALAEQRLKVVSMVAYAPVALVTGHGPGVPTDDNESCLMCHDSVLAGTTTTRGITMNHRAPDRESWSCVRCHSGAAHPGERYVGSSYSMDMCLACHNANPENTTTCGLCHPADEAPDTTHRTAWAVTHGPRWRSAHGMGDLATCSSCHSAGYCAACHQLDLPHPGNYLARHGSDVLTRSTGDADCVVCHRGAACDNCHGLEMPHPDAFTRDHASVVAEQSEAVCERCHDPAGCESCHAEHVHPGVPADLLRQLQDRPVAP